MLDKEEQEREDNFYIKMKNIKERYDSDKNTTVNEYKNKHSQESIDKFKQNKCSERSVKINVGSGLIEKARFD